MDSKKRKIDTILLDADGVILDWMNSFKHYMASKGHLSIYKEEHRYNLTDVFELDEYEIATHIKKFNESESFTNINLYDGAYSALRELSANYELIVISSCGNNSQSMRVKNLEDHFGKDFFKKIMTLDFGISKETELSKYKSSFWIEDLLKNYQIGKSLGHRSILIGRPWNQDKDKSIDRVKCWGEILKRIRREG